MAPLSLSPEGVESAIPLIFLPKDVSSLFVSPAHRYVLSPCLAFNVSFKADKHVGLIA